MEQSMTTDPRRPLSAAEVQALHRRVLDARDLDVDPDPRDLAMVHQLNADELARFDHSLGADGRSRRAPAAYALSGSVAGNDDSNA